MGVLTPKHPDILNEYYKQLEPTQNHVMRPELQSVGNFLAYLIKTSTTRKVKVAKLENFTTRVIEVLQRHYRHRWHIEQPWKGSNYREIKINPRARNPYITKAANMADIKEKNLYRSLPAYVCIWIDPLQVTYRIGECGYERWLFKQGNDSTNTAWEAKNGHGRLKLYF